MQATWGETAGRARLGAVLPLAVAASVLLLAGSGYPDWRRGAAVHFLAFLGLAGCGLSLLVRARFLPERWKIGRWFGANGGVGRMGVGPAAALLTLFPVLIASSLLSSYPAIGLRRVWAWACLAGWAYLLARLAPTTGALHLLLRLVGGAAGAACAAALWHSASHGWGPPGIPLIFVNHCGALAALALPLHLTLVTLERRWAGRSGWCLAAAAAMTTLILCRSTAAFAAALAASAIWGAAAVVGWLGVRRDLAAGALACCLVFASGLVPLLLARGDLAERSGWSQAARAMESGAGGYKDSPRFHWRRLLLLAEGKPDSNVAARLRFGRATLEALRQEPLLGFGPGSVPLTFARYRLQVPGASPWGEAVGQLHSVSLQRVYESGFAGALAFISWIVLCVLGLPVSDPAWARMRAGMAAAVGALAVAGLADALEGGPFLVGVAVATLALLAARPEARARERVPRWLLAGLGAAALAAALAGGADSVREGIAHRRADRAVERVAREGFGEAVLEDLRAAARLDPLVGLYEHQAAYAAEELALAEAGAGRAEAAQPLLQEAERLYLRAAGSHPHVPGFASQAGNFLLDRDRPLEAIPYLRRAVALDYYDPLGHFYLGEALRLAGDEEGAVDAHARSMRYYPRLSGAALYQAAGNENLRRRVLERLRALLVAEAATRPPDSPAERLRRFVEEALAQPDPGAGGAGQRIVLVHRFDQLAGKSRAWHLFERGGFTMENLPVSIVEEPGSYDEDLWARVLEGLPALTAARIGVSEGGGVDGEVSPPERPAGRPMKCGLPAAGRSEREAGRHEAGSHELRNHEVKG